MKHEIQRFDFLIRIFLILARPVCKKSRVSALIGDFLSHVWGLPEEEDDDDGTDTDESPEATPVPAVGRNVTESARACRYYSS